MDGTFDDDVVHAWLAGVVSNAWVSLHYETPAVGGLGRGEISGGGYVRRLINFATPSNRATWSLDDAKFTGLPANRLTHFGIWNAKTGGAIQCWGQLPDKTLVVQGGGYVLHAGKLALSIE